MNYKIAMRSVNTFIFDIDGVLTDGSVAILENELQRSLHSRDCFALQFAAKMGFKIFIITGGESQIIRQILLNLGVSEVYLNSRNKLEVFKDIQNNFQISTEEVLYMGDDMPDIPLLREVRLACCPQDACPEVKRIVNYVSPIVGGKGCVRDVIEQTMKVQQKWDNEEAFYW